MKHQKIWLCIYLFLFGLAGCTTLVEEAQFERSRTSYPNLYEYLSLPEFELPTPRLEADKAYLGLSGNGKFRVADIQSEIVIIMLYSIYCPYCRNEAPRINELYRIIEHTADFKGKIKIIGIGVRNSESEVEKFKKNYSVSYPLFPDADSSIARSLKIQGTPTFIAVKNNQSENPMRISTEPGSVGDIYQFIEKIISYTEPAESLEENNDTQCPEIL